MKNMVNKTQLQNLNFAKKRWQKFFKSHAKFAKLWSDYFINQTEKFIKNHYTKQQIKKETHHFEKDLIDVLFFVYSLWSELINKQINWQIMFWISFDIDNTLALEYAKTRAWELILKSDKTTQKEVSKIINAGLERNLPAKEISKIIRRRFKKYSYYRASLISTMELSNAYEYGKLKQFEKYTNHFWVSWYKKNVDEADSNTRESHRQNTLDGWIKASELFSWTQTSHAPHWFNCRCNTLYSLYNLDKEEI